MADEERGLGVQKLWMMEKSVRLIDTIGMFDKFDRFHKIEQTEQTGWIESAAG